MYKYTLYFKNKETESQYQQHLEKTQRILALNLITIGYLLTFGIKIGNSLIDQNFNFLFLKIGLLIYSVLQHFIVRWKPQYIRFAFILSNLANQLTNLEKDSITNLEISYLKGSNTMAFNFLIILAGEFPDAIIVFTFQTVYKIFSTFGFGSTINLSVLCNCIYVYIASFLYFYYYHKARRSQYILGLVDNCWDNILDKLIQQPFLLLNFNFENLKFEVKKVTNFPFLKFESNKINEQVTQEIKQYLRQTTIQNQTLEKYIHCEIKKFQQTAQNTFDIFVKTQYQRKLIELEISLFQSKEPTILIRMRKQVVQSKRLLKQYQCRFQSYNKFMINFLTGLQKHYNQFNIKRIQRKLFSIALLDQIMNRKYYLKTIHFQIYFSKLESMFQGISITLINFSDVISFKTIFNIFSLLVLQILENAFDNQILIEIKNKSQRIKIQILGNYQILKVQRFINRVQYPLNLILEQYKIKDKKIQLLLYTEPIAAFGTEIY